MLEDHPRLFARVVPLTLGLTVVVSFGGLSFGLLLDWPLWAIGLATVIPCLPVFTMDVARVLRAYQWLSAAMRS